MKNSQFKQSVSNFGTNCLHPLYQFKKFQIQFPDMPLLSIAENPSVEVCQAAEEAKTILLAIYKRGHM